VADFFFSHIVWIAMRMPRRDTLLPNFYQIGVFELSGGALTGTFIGMVLAVQKPFAISPVEPGNSFGRRHYMSLVANWTGLAGGHECWRAESQLDGGRTGHMRVTEQIDAMAAWAPTLFNIPSYPDSRLPDLIPTLTIVADFMGVAGGVAYAVLGLGIDSNHSFGKTRRITSARLTCFPACSKPVFGAAIALISCYRGFHCDPGAEGVGRGRDVAFVISFVLILVPIFFLGIALDNLYMMIWPEGVRTFVKPFSPLRPF